MIRVYIAGPITKGPWDENIGKAIEMYNEIFDLGFAPYLPHLNFFCSLMKRREFKKWIELDFVWLAHCNVLFRLPGESTGADMEVAEAKRLGIPIVYGLGELITIRNTQEC